MLPRNVVIVDLEFGDQSICDPAAKTTPILEIGALSVTESGEVVNTFSELVRPYDGTWNSVTPKILQLTGLTEQELRAARYWHKVLEDFRQFCGKTALASWGYDDTYLMRRWCGYTGTAYGLSSEVYDLRTMFNVEYLKQYPDQPIPKGLTQACKRLHITPPIHRGLDDCKRVLQLFEVLYNVNSNQQEDTDLDEPFQLFEF